MQVLVYISFELIVTSYRTKEPVNTSVDTTTVFDHSNSPNRSERSVRCGGKVEVGCSRNCRTCTIRPMNSLMEIQGSIPRSRTISATDIMRETLLSVLAVTKHSRYCTHSTVLVPHIYALTCTNLRTKTLWSVIVVESSEACGVSPSRWSRRGDYG